MIIKMVDLVAYKSPLLDELLRVPNVFHFSMLCKYITNLLNVLEALDIDLREDLSCIKQLVHILNDEERVLHN